MTATPRYVDFTYVVQQKQCHPEYVPDSSYKKTQCTLCKCWPITRDIRPLREIAITNTRSSRELFDLILDSDDLEDEKFVHWLTSEVLPTIRKTGRYDLPKESPHWDSPTVRQLMMLLDLESADRYYNEVKTRQQLAREYADELDRQEAITTGEVILEGEVVE